MSKKRETPPPSPIDAHAWHVALNSDEVKREILKHDSAESAARDPEFNKVFDNAYWGTYDAVTDDPIAYERREAERLCAIVKERYSVPGLAAQYLGNSISLLEGTQHYPVFGCWKMKSEPPDFQAVHELLWCVRDASKTHLSPAELIFSVKRLTALLRQAQEACGEQPEPLAISTMTPAEWEVVAVLYAMDASNVTWATGIDPLLEKLNSNGFSDSDKTRQRQLQRLREKQIVLTDGKVSKMKYYLSPIGWTCGEYLIRSCRVVL